jgi:hypothetical protein
MTIGQVMNHHDIDALLKSLQIIYARHITSPKLDILPTLPDPPELVRCIGMVREPALKVTEQNSRSMPDKLPSVSVKMTGSIKVLSEGEGVRVDVELKRK